MTSLDNAILKTIIYADIFNFPMTPKEIHHFLIHDQSVDFPSIEKQLEDSPWLKRHLVTDGTYYALTERTALFEIRQQKELMMTGLSKRMIFYGRLLTYFPFVEMVGITGALAMRNPHSMNDDLDYIIITRPGRVWLARAIIIFLVRLMRFRNIEICPNYVLASNQLSQERRDLYIAHEVVQLLPLNNDSLYQSLRNQNIWTDQYLPNATHPLYQHDNKRSSKLGLGIKQGFEWILTSPIGTWLEKWEFRRKSNRFKKEAQQPTASAQIDEGHVKGHFNDYGQLVLTRYEERLRELAPDSDLYQLQSVGD